MSRIKVKKNYLACLIGVAVTAGLSLLLILLLPVFIANEYLPIEYARAATIVLMAVVTFCGAAVAGRCAEDRVGTVQIFSIGTYCLLWLLATIFVYDGLSFEALIRALACAVGCAAAILVLNKAKKSRGRRKKRRANR